MRSARVATLAPGRRASARAWLIAGAIALGALAAPASRADDALIAAPSATDAVAGPLSREADRVRHGSPLDERVRLVTAELDLDAAQQAKVRRLLEEQRDQVSRVWSNSAIPSASRIGATQAISERTADEIRALLNAEQRQKYLAARTPRTAAADRPEHGLDYWMERSRAAR